MPIEKEPPIPPPVIGKIGYYTVFVTPPTPKSSSEPSPVPESDSKKKKRSCSPVRPPPVHYEKSASLYGSKFDFFWDAIAKLQNAHSSLDDYVAYWFGLNQSKYQWALDDYYESKGMVSAASRKDTNQRLEKAVQREGKRNTGDPAEHCTCCGKDGRNWDGCFKRIGYPDWWPGKKIEMGKPKAAACVETEGSPLPGLTADQYKQFLKLFSSGSTTGAGPTTNMAHATPTVNSTGKTNLKDCWVVDSGATDHIAHDASVLENIAKTDHELSVTMPNGVSVTVEGRGDYILQNGTKIKKVLHVPDFNCNLISVSKLCNDIQCAVTFFPYFFVMQSLRSRTLIGLGRCKNGPY